MVLSYWILQKVFFFFIRKVWLRWRRSYATLQTTYLTVIGECTHCNKNPIYVFLLRKLRGLSPNFHIHVSVSDPHISCNRIGRSIVGIYKSLTDTWMWKLGLRPYNSFSGNICLQFSVWLFAVHTHQEVIRFFWVLINDYTVKLEEW